jgi:hypothetical protein
VYEPLSPAHSTISRPRSRIDRILDTFVKQKKTKKYQRVYEWRSYVKGLMYIHRYRINDNQRDYNKYTSLICNRFDRDNNKLRNAFYIWMKVKRNYDDIKNNFKNIKTQEKINQRLLEKDHEMILNIIYNEKLFENKRNVFMSWKNNICNIQKKVKEPINVSSDPYRVVLNYDIQEDGHVNVKVSAPLASIYENYFSKLKSPPIDEYVKALEEFGYPKWMINKIKSKHTKPANTINVQEQIAGIVSKPTKKASTLKKFKK